MMASAMNPAIRLYSMAVAPLSSRRNFRSIPCLPNFDKKGVARPSCRYKNQNRKIVRSLKLRLLSVKWFKRIRGLVFRANVFWPTSFDERNTASPA